MDSTQRGGKRGYQRGEAEGSSRNMYKGHMDKAKGGVRLRLGGEDGWDGGSGGGKMETTVLEQQVKKENNSYVPKRNI